MSSSKIALLFFGVMSLIGIGLSATAYHFWQSNHRLKTEGVATTGTVVGYKSQTHTSNSRKSRQYSHSEAAVVEFVDTQGQTQTIASNVYTSPRRFSVGAQVKIWYDSKNPELMLVAGAEEWLLTTILGIVGGLLTLAGVPNLFKTIWAMLQPKRQIV